MIIFMRITATTSNPFLAFDRGSNTEYSTKGLFGFCLTGTSVECTTDAYGYLPHDDYLHISYPNLHL